MTADSATAEKRWGLPPVSPGIRRAVVAIYRLLWLALLLVALTAPVAGLLQKNADMERRWDPFQDLGLTYDSPDGASIRLKAFSDEARRSGIREGDRMLAVDGRPLSDSAAEIVAIAARLKGPEGSVVRLTTRSADGAVREHRLTRTDEHLNLYYAGAGLTPAAFKWIDIGFGLFPNYLLAAVAILLFRRRPNDPVASLLSVAFLGIAASIAMAGFFFAGRLDWIGELLNGIGWTGFILTLLVFPDGRFMPRWTRWLALLLLPFAIANFLYLMPPMGANILYLGFLTLGVASLTVRYRRMPPGPVRQQIRWTLFGFATGVAGTAAAVLSSEVATRSDDPVTIIWGSIGTIALSSVGISLLALGLLVSLLRYRLYDADAVISRSAGYAVMTIGLVTVFACSEKVIELVGERYFEGGAGAISGGIAAGLAAVLIGPLHGRVHHWAERRFRRGLIQLRRGLPQCVDDLRETAGMETLLREVLARIAAGVRARHSAALVGGEVAATREIDAGTVEAWRADAALDGDTGSGRDRSDALFPLRIPLRPAHSEGETLGWLLLGPRPDGSFYGRDEREVLAEIADPVARAVAIVRQRTAREAMLDAHAARQDRRIASIERRLAKLAAAIGAPS